MDTQPTHLAMIPTREQRWNDMLSGLTPWELHWLFQGERELTLHDAYINREATMASIVEFIHGEVHHPPVPTA